MIATVIISISTSNSIQKVGRLFFREFKITQGELYSKVASQKSKAWLRVICRTRVNLTLHHRKKANLHRLTRRNISNRRHQRNHKIRKLISSLQETLFKVLILTFWPSTCLKRGNELSR